ncbi:MAG: tRNA preQ1(34) S-adenosylmethionine ribosyltransferase-isomerase QueA [Parvularculaceae bacterium]|nr:tRNA preQ1(34) S-adenosylmethionine ribosyltransferase-isomerase QueA [Parvularculaceae bacterium]
MRVADFDFDLPESAIALEPARPRDSARLLHVTEAGLADHRVRDLPALLRPRDLLVLNDTRVIPAQLEGVRPARPSGGGGPVVVEATLLKRLAPEGEGARWTAFLRPARRLRAGDRIAFAPDFEAEVETRDDAEATLRFSVSGAAFDAALARHGKPPLPPYIARRRGWRDADVADYQTVYAADAGSVAAPTAGLHFTDDLFAALGARGVGRVAITLHVGAGTFLPVATEDAREHRMHAEWGEITAQQAAAINAARAAGGRIVAVGTTSLRLLESAAREDGVVEPFCRETSIFITPGYRFRAVDVLMTNFHLPRSTLFMLVSAFCGLERMRRAYAHAVATGYRFYSYGDAGLLERAP